MSSSGSSGQARNAGAQPAAREPASSRWAALRIALIYGFIGAAWILLSDRVLYAIFNGGATTMQYVSMAKGWLYVLFTAALLHQLISRSMQALRQARHAAELAREEAEKANHAKDRFLAVLSHELRTPLTPVLASVAALQRQPQLDPALREDVAVIRRNIEMEARLIDDLLDLTRIASGKMHMELHVADAHQVLRSAMQICDCDLQGRKLNIELRLEAAEHHVHGDTTRLMQVFWNLIRNAIKYTGDGGRIVIRTANESGLGSRVSGLSNASPSPDSALSTQHSALIVEVCDSGMGIDPRLMPRIFNAFEQSEDPATRRLGGLGLGLAISRSIIEQHGGTISAQSDGPGCGSKFTLRLPTVPAPRPVEAIKPVDPPAPAVPAGPISILLVEDNPDSARMLARLLRMMKHKVRVAGTVEQALAAAREERFDLLLSDIALPDGTGHEVMQQLQQIRHTPGIALSGFGMDEDIRRSLEVGFLEHLTKPVCAERLEEAIAHVRSACTAGV